MKKSEPDVRFRLAWMQLDMNINELSSVRESEEDNKRLIWRKSIEYICEVISGAYIKTT